MGGGNFFLVADIPSAAKVPIVSIIHSKVSLLNITLLKNI